MKNVLAILLLFLSASTSAQKTLADCEPLAGLYVISDGLQFSGFSLEDKNSGQTLPSYKVAQGMTIRIKLEHPRGFSLSPKGDAFFGVGLTVSDASGAQIGQIEDVYAGQNASGPEELLNMLSMTLEIDEQFKLGEEYQLEARFFDKRGKAEATVYANVQVVESLSDLGGETFSKFLSKPIRIIRALGFNPNSFEIKLEGDLPSSEAVKIGQKISLNGNAKSLGEQAGLFGNANLFDSKGNIVAKASTSLKDENIVLKFPKGLDAGLYLAAFSIENRTNNHQVAGSQWLIYDGGDDSQNALLKQQLAQLYFQKAKGAKKTFGDRSHEYLWQEAVRLDPTLADAWAWKAESLRIEATYEKALEVAQKGLEQQENHALLNYEAGRACLYLKKHQDAIQYLQRATELDKNLYSAYYNLGWIYNDLGQFSDAVPYLEQAVVLGNKAIPEAYVELAYALKKAKKYKEAMEVYTSYLELYPYDAKKWYDKGYVAIDAKSYDIAVEALTKAIEIKEDYTDAYYERGYALKQQLKYEEATKDFLQVAENLKETDSGLLWKAYLHAGDCQKELGQKDAACENYRKAAPKVEQAASELADLCGQ